MPAIGRFARRVDVALIATLAVAAALRGFQLSQPNRLYFDEFYAQDACVYLGWPATICGQSMESSWMHPPLGKWFISTGIALFGFEPIAWRLASAAAGTAMVGLVFVLARALTRSALGAALAALLVALDPLLLVSSRIAMLDIFTACAGVAAVLFLVLDADRAPELDTTRHRYFRPWLIAAGLAVGVAVATKWSGLLVVVVALCLFLARELATPSQPTVRRFGGLAASLPTAVTWLVVLPAIVYLGSYLGQLDGEVVALPWQEGAWLRAVVDRQRDMYVFHSSLETTHPYSSPAWSWLLAKRPVVFYVEPDGGALREILAVANPLVWVPGAMAAVVALTIAVRRRFAWGAALVIGVSAAGSYLPWLLLPSDRSQIFLYYVLPTLPFLALALGWVAASLPRQAGRTFAGVVVALSLAALIFWAPLIYGWPLDGDGWRSRMLFADCGDQPATELGPPIGDRAPPSGWCWI